MRGDDGGSGDVAAGGQYWLMTWQEKARMAVLVDNSDVAGE